MNAKLREQTKELTLILLYLHSFGDESYCRSWKGYNFDNLNELAEQGYISDNRRAKSVMLYNEGIAQAKILCKQYGLALDETHEERP